MMISLYECQINELAHYNNWADVMYCSHILRNNSTGPNIVLVTLFWPHILTHILGLKRKKSILLYLQLKEGT